MKTGLLLCFLLALGATAARAQGNYPYTPGDTATVPARYQQVVAVPGVSADELYARAREWVALTFEDVHQAVQLDDPQRRLLIGSGYTLGYAHRANGKGRNAVPLWFRFRFEAREGRYRLELTDFGSVKGFLRAQYASNDIANWLAASRATRLASTRHSDPLPALPAPASTVSPDDQQAIKSVVERASAALFTSLKQVATATPAAW